MCISPPPPQKQCRKKDKILSITCNIVLRPENASEFIWEHMTFLNFLGEDPRLFIPPPKPKFWDPLMATYLLFYFKKLYPAPGVPEAFKGRGGKSHERGIQGGGSESPRLRERGILPCSAIFFVVVKISMIKTSKIWCTLAPG